MEEDDDDDNDDARLPKHALNYKSRGRRDLDAPGNDGNASVLEQVKRPNPWRKMMMMMMMMMMMKNVFIVTIVFCLKLSQILLILSTTLLFPAEENMAVTFSKLPHK